MFSYGCRLSDGPKAPPCLRMIPRLRHACRNSRMLLAGRALIHCAMVAEKELGAAEVLINVAAHTGLGGSNHSSLSVLVRCQVQRHGSSWHRHRLQQPTRSTPAATNVCACLGVHARMQACARTHACVCTRAHVYVCVTCAHVCEHACIVCHHDRWCMSGQ